MSPLVVIDEHCAYSTECPCVSNKLCVVALAGVSSASHSAPRIVGLRLAQRIKLGAAPVLDLHAAPCRRRRPPAASRH